MGFYRFGQYFVISESQIEKSFLIIQNKTKHNKTSNTSKYSENYFSVITCIGSNNL